MLLFVAVGDNSGAAYVVALPVVDIIIICVMNHYVMSFSRFVY